METFENTSERGRGRMEAGVAEEGVVMEGKGLEGSGR